MRFLVSLLLLLAAPVWLVAPAWAATSTPHGAEALTARLVAAEDVVTPGSATLSAGLDVQLADGWKTYWRTPGEVGLAPQLNWSRSANVSRVDILYPAPTRFRAFDIENYGYAGRVLYPLEIHLKRPGEPAELQLDATVLVCAEMCVPETFSLALALPAAAAPVVDTQAAELIARYAARVPAPRADTVVTRATTQSDTSGDTLVVTAASTLPFREPQLFAEYGDLVFDTPRVRLSGDARALRAELPILKGDPDRIKEGVVTLVDAHRAVEAGAWLRASSVRPPAGVVVPAAFAPADARDAGAQPSWLGFVALAFVGGLILNLMPCVLPVLSIKLAGALAHRERGLSRIRRGFLLSAAGVMTFALGLAAVLIGLRASGVAVGWGMQFQNPLFLTFVIAVLALFALAMLDRVVLDLPASWNRRMALAGSQAGGGGATGDFLTGAFAALLATPCSAPFLGTAVAFALAGGTGDVLAVFAALGLGLAAPYLLVAARPSLVRRLPRPGPWMVWLRRVLALALVATALWLLSVLAAVSGPWVALAVAVLVALAALLLAVPLERRLRLGAAGAAALAALVVPIVGPTVVPGAVASDRTVASAADHVWTDFDRAAIATRVARGETVFVDVTAEWCLTCKVNKRRVLTSAYVERELATITAMRADWTRPDDAILAYLKDHGRYGIPFNAVYGPGAPEGIVLSELLTNDAVLRAIERARGG